MNRRWTFGRTVSVSFASITLLSVLVGICAIASLQYVSMTKDRVITVDQRLVVLAAQMGDAFAEKRAVVRGYLMTGDDSYLTEASAAQKSFLDAAGEARQLAHTTEAVRLIDQVTGDSVKHQEAIDAVVAMRKAGQSLGTNATVMTASARKWRMRNTSRLVLSIG